MPLSYWRLRPWWAFRQNMDGVMIFCWAYLVHWEWGRSKHLPPVPTAGYEALTQGMEDYSLLDMLKKAIDQANKLGLGKDAAAAQKVLDSAIENTVQKTTTTFTEAQLADTLENNRVLLGNALAELLAKIDKKK